MRESRWCTRRFHHGSGWDWPASLGPVPSDCAETKSVNADLWVFAYKHKSLQSTIYNLQTIRFIRSSSRGRPTGTWHTLEAEMELAPVRNGVYPFVGGFTYLKLIYSRMGAKHILHKQRDPNHSWMIFIHLFFLALRGVHSGRPLLCFCMGEITSCYSCLCASGISECLKSQ